MRSWRTLVTPLGVTFVLAVLILQGGTAGAFGAVATGVAFMYSTPLISYGVAHVGATGMAPVTFEEALLFEASASLLLIGNMLVNPRSGTTIRVWIAGMVLVGLFIGARSLPLYWAAVSLFVGFAVVYYVTHRYELIKLGAAQ